MDEETPLLSENRLSESRQGLLRHDTIAALKSIRHQGFLKNGSLKSIRRLKFDPSSHASVLFRFTGSVWGNVMPYCILNCVITWVVAYLRGHGYDFTCKPLGHKFMAMLVSFLVVARSGIIYARYTAARNYLANLYSACRSLVRVANALSAEDKSDKGKQWRRQVAQDALILLKVSMAALEFRSNHRNIWEASDISGDVSNELLVEHDLIAKKWAHGHRTSLDENLRAPTYLALKLRITICSQRQELDTSTRFHPLSEQFLFKFVSDYTAAFHGLIKLITTQFPFPLVQMARTVLFFWVFTLPLCLLHDESSRCFKVMTMVFFITYGFMGLEYVSMELDDPFGDDPNDFDNKGMAEMVYEDVYVNMYKTDGEDSAFELRNFMAEVNAKKRAT